MGGAEQSLTQRTEARLYTDPAEMTSRTQPLQNRLKRIAVPNQHNLGTLMLLWSSPSVLDQWQDNMLPTRLLQGHNLVNTIAATGVFEKFQEEKPPMTRERKCLEAEPH